MEIIHSETEQPGDYPHRITVRSHVIRTDLETAAGGADTAPSAHDYFDAALASCKSLTAMWYAKKNGMPLERVDVQVERDDSEERKGRYVLHVRLAFHGPLSDEQRTRLYAAVGKCPVHKLMTSTEVVIETAPL